MSGCRHLPEATKDESLAPCLANPIFHATITRRRGNLAGMAIQLVVEELGPDTAVVTFEGSLNLGSTLLAADNQLQGLIGKGVTRLVLDLSAVPYCDSAGLGVLVHTYGLAEQNGGKVRICGASGRVAGVFKMTRTDTFLAIDADRAASIAALTA
jgi:anti-sigma B factor antagonist